MIVQELPMTEIEPLFFVEDSIAQAAYLVAIRSALKQILPAELVEKLDDPAVSPEAKDELLTTALPLLTLRNHNGRDLSLYSLSCYRPDAFKFLFDMISQWLCPGRRLNVLLFYASDFRLTHGSGTAYTFCEITIRVTSDEELEQIQTNLPYLEAEIRPGMDSIYYARRVLEMKGLTSSEKSAFIHEKIHLLMHRRPQWFGEDLFREMQYLLVLCPDAFKERHSSNHLVKLIAATYLFRKSLAQKTVSGGRLQRNILFKILSPPTLTLSASTLALLVGIKLRSDKERFEREHLFATFKELFPDAVPRADSFLSLQRRHEAMCIVYAEIVFPEKTVIGEYHRALLKRRLPEVILGRIEEPLAPLFMPRNEEELMRSIVMLSHELRAIDDPPQVVINFDSHTEKELCFTIIIVRPVTYQSRSMEELLMRSNAPFRFIKDRIRLVGSLRKQASKEASVFHLHLEKDLFLRSDFSVDLLSARQAIVERLKQLMGTVRDFNGGLLERDVAALQQLKKELLTGEPINELFIENFFHAILPAQARSATSTRQLRSLFLMMQVLFERIQSDPSGSYVPMWQKEEEAILGVAALSTPVHREQLLKALPMFPEENIVSTVVTLNEQHLLGLLFRSHSKEERESLQRLFARWSHTLGKGLHLLLFSFVLLFDSLSGGAPLLAAEDVVECVWETKQPCKRSPRLAILFSGLPCMGKTTLARRLEEQFQVARISSDELRATLRREHGLPNGSDAEIKLESVLQEAIFDCDRRPLDHALILDRSIDGSELETRQFFSSLGYDLFIIRLEASPEAVLERLADRPGHPGPSSSWQEAYFSAECSLFDFVWRSDLSPEQAAAQSEELFTLLKERLRLLPAIAEDLPHLSPEATERLYTLLMLVQPVLETCGIPYWAACGTLLGAYRHEGMIPWDDDIDLFIDLSGSETFLDELATCLKAKGLALFSHDDEYFKIFFKDDVLIPDGNGGIYPWRYPFIDLFPIAPLDEERYSYQAERLRRAFSERDFFLADDLHRAHRAPFGPTTLPVFDRGIDYLNRVYGEEWPFRAFASYSHREEKPLQPIKVDLDSQTRSPL